MIDQDKYQEIVESFRGVPGRVAEVKEAVTEKVEEVTGWTGQVFVTDLTTRAFALGVFVGVFLAIIARHF